MRRSISRTLSRYSPSRARSPASSPLCRRDDLVGHRVEDAPVLLLARQALRRVGAVAEQPLEDHLRAVLHRQRQRVVPPGDGVVVRAAVAGAAVQRHFLDAHFDRRQRRVLADVLGEHLIDGLAAVHGALLGMRAAQEHRRRARVIRAGVRALAAGQRVRQVADDVQAVAEFLERLQRLGELEAAAFRRRRPLVHRRAVRDVDAAEAALRRAPRSAPAACRAGTIESSSGSASVTPIPRRNVRRGRCFLVMKDMCAPVCLGLLSSVYGRSRAHFDASPLSTCSSETARSSRRPAPDRENR